jgi:hypothetical protein
MFLQIKAYAQVVSHFLNVARSELGNYETREHDLNCSNWTLGHHLFRLPSTPTPHPKPAQPH